jgi:hypothetical protein
MRVWLRPLRRGFPNSDFDKIGLTKFTTVTSLVLVNKIYQNRRIFVLVRILFSMLWEIKTQIATYIAKYVLSL